MPPFDIQQAAALLGYLTLFVGFVVLGSAGLAFIQTIPARLRHRNEPSYFRIQRVRPENFFYDLGPDGRITDAFEVNDERTAIIAEHHEHDERTEYAEYGAALHIAQTRTGTCGPHCDSMVLHAPGICVVCDKYPDLQEHRLLHGINFTGGTDATKLPCPATTRRPLETIERWYGNVAKQADWLPEDDDEERPVCD